MVRRGEIDEARSRTQRGSGYLLFCLRMAGVASNGAITVES